ncbi:HAD family hydrolase [bacterium SCSIO 12741]|nr:HAD family hydrolase [bacterium SCSIO 12741]
MNKAIFLDRDGVINRERGTYTWKEEDFEFTPGLFESLVEWQNKGYKLIVITNQGGVAKGLYSLQEVYEVHQYMSEALAEKGIELTDIYLSPYHQDYSLSLSRKPDSQMLEKAIAVHRINPEDSFMIGDSERDVVAANKVGVKGILIEPNSDIRNLLPQIP